MPNIGQALYAINMVNSSFVAYLLIAVIGSAYFMLARRNFDLFALAYASALFYFMPGFFGYVLYPNTEQDFIHAPVNNATYTVMALILACILFTAWMQHMSPRLKPPSIVLESAGLAPHLVLVMALIGAAGTVATAGTALLSPDKIHLLRVIDGNHWYVLASSASALACVMAWEMRRHIVFFMALLLLLIDIFLGFRVNAVLALIAIITLQLNRLGVVRLLAAGPRAMAVAIGLAVLFVLHKGLYELIKQGHWAEVTSKLMSTDFYLDSIDNVEPFVTQAILNRVLESAYRVPLDSLNSAWFALIPYNLPGGVGAPLSFNDLFQPVLFHGVNWMQMANNVWAQAWAAGGLLLLLLFVFVFLIVLMLGNYLIRAQSSAIRAGSALFFSTWAFYFHRNDLLYQFLMQKRILMLWLLAIAGSYLLMRVWRSASRSARENHPVKMSR